MPFDPTKFEKYTHYKVEEIQTGFIHVAFNNPKTLNAFADEDWQAYHEILVTLDADEDTNVILVLSTFPKAFTSGLNLKAAMGVMGEGHGSSHAQRKHLLNHIKDFQYCIGTPARINTPTIGLINGVAYGLALDIAACFSIRVCTEDVKFSIREIKIGIAADIGLLQRLPNVCGNQLLLNQYALTGEVFGHKEAVALGLVSHVSKNFEEGLEYCKDLGLDINSNRQWAIKGTKQHLQQMADGILVEDGLNSVAEFNATNISGDFVLDMSKVKL